MLHRRDCTAVVASTLALAQGLGTVTTAEGVETEEQFEYMRAAGVDLVQGYLFGRPVPISQLDLHTAAVPREMLILPAIPVSSPFAKIFDFAGPKSPIIPCRPVPQRGGSRSSRTRGGMRWTRMRL